MCFNNCAEKCGFYFGKWNESILPNEEDPKNKTTTKTGGPKGLGKGNGEIEKVNILFVYHFCF